MCWYVNKSVFYNIYYKTIILISRYRILWCVELLTYYITVVVIETYQNLIQKVI